MGNAVYLVVCAVLGYVAGLEIGAALLGESSVWAAALYVFVAGVWVQFGQQAMKGL